MNGVKEKKWNPLIVRIYKIIKFAVIKIKVYSASEMINHIISMYIIIDPKSNLNKK